MKAQVIELTPQVATQYLELNSANRTVQEARVAEYAYALRNGHWKANGSTIVVDTHGIVRDGQHRMIAVERTGIPMPVILVTEVTPDVMPTIDTGRPRSLSDVLKLENFQYSNNVAAVVKRILSYERNQTANRPGENTNKVTNIIGRDYALRNRYNLHNLVSKAAHVYNQSTTKVIPVTSIAFYMWLLQEYIVDDEIITFMKALTGQSTADNSAASWLYTKLYAYKQERVTPSPKWVLGMVIKAWNSFKDGNPAVGYMKFDVTDDLPEIKGRHF